MQNQIEFKNELKMSVNSFFLVFNEFEMSFNRKKSWSQAFSHMRGPGPQGPLHVRKCFERTLFSIKFVYPISFQVTFQISHWRKDDVFNKIGFWNLDSWKTQNPWKTQKPCKRNYKNNTFWNNVLGPISFSSSRNLVQNRTSSSENCALRAELWRFEVAIRISVPMLYITFL